MTGTCFLCGNWETVEKHHIFGGALRPKADKLGLTVELCPWCHQYDADSAHKSGATRQYLRKYGQAKVMRERGWGVERFVQEFGKNYLDEEEIREIEAERTRPDQYPLGHKGIGPCARPVGNSEVCVVGFQLMETGVELPW